MGFAFGRMCFCGIIDAKFRLFEWGCFGVRMKSGTVKILSKHMTFFSTFIESAMEGVCCSVLVGEEAVLRWLCHISVPFFVFSSIFLKKRGKASRKIEMCK